MEAVNKEELVRAFHLMWDNYPEMVRLIDRKFNIIAGNTAFYKVGGQDGVKQQNLEKGHQKNAECPVDQQFADGDDTDHERAVGKRMDQRI